jgi:hypothetical protein
VTSPTGARMVRPGSSTSPNAVSQAADSTAVFGKYPVHATGDRQPTADEPPAEAASPAKLGAANSQSVRTQSKKVAGRSGVTGSASGRRGSKAGGKGDRGGGSKAGAAASHQSVDGASSADSATRAGVGSAQSNVAAKPSSTVRLLRKQPDVGPS